MSREAKSILGLIVLLTWPCLGPGGRAGANFALGKSAKSPAQPGALIGFELKLVLSDDEGDHARCQPSSRMDRDDLPDERGDSPRWPCSFKDGFPALPGLLSDGASTAGSPSTSGAEERFKPPPFTFRWFRPPR